MMRRFFDMPLLLVTGFAFGFIGAMIAVALCGDKITDQQIRLIFFCACLVPAMIGGVSGIRTQPRKLRSEDE